MLIAAGLVARKARAKGLKPKPWVKTSLAPGSQVVTDYLNASGLSEDLNALGFDLVGYGCTTCIGNSGPLPEPISKAINDNDLVAASVLSGNRNFEGRVIARLPRQLPRLAAAGGRLSRSRARSAPTWSTTRSAPAATASRCSSRTSGRRTTKSAR